MALLQARCKSATIARAHRPSQSFARSLRAPLDGRVGGNGVNASGASDDGSWVRSLHGPLAGKPG
jgi:hypothetical protein